MNNILTKFRISFLLAAFIIFLSTFTFGPINIEQEIPFFDKWVHFLMYASMSFALLFDFTKNSESRKICGLMMIYSFLLATLLGGLMELVQGLFLEHRSGDWMDALANTVGAALGVCVGKLLIPYFLKIYFKIFKDKKAE